MADAGAILNAKFLKRFKGFFFFNKEGCVLSVSLFYREV